MGIGRIESDAKSRALVYVTRALLSTLTLRDKIMRLMEYKGYKAQIMEAERLTGDYVHGLPPGSPLEVF
jgi:hypothetical protein